LRHLLGLKRAEIMVGRKGKVGTAAFLAALYLGAIGPETASAGPVSKDVSISELSSQQRIRRPRVRVYVNRQVRALPPDAVRQCRAWYVQEARPSGVVIVPRMQCWWERG
jgi:hypothetical protein